MAVQLFTLLTSLLAVASASPCKPPAYVLPSTGTGTDLPIAGSDVKVLKIAVGHGIQNYTCSNTSASVVNTGALAVLYDVTALYPGTRRTGLAADVFYALTGYVLRSQPLPLILANSAAAAAAELAETDFGAVAGNPFPAAASLQLPGIPAPDAPFLGHHYFDAAGIPTFDLSGTSGGLFGSLSKTGDVKAPSSADAGLLATGAVDWLQLAPNANGLSKGIKLVYRVVTAGGASQACSVVNATAGSVPYSAFYWFFG